MAKTLANIIAEAKQLCDEEFDNAQWVEWLNEALDDLSPVLYIDAVSNIPKVDGVFRIPDRYLETIRLDGIKKNLSVLAAEDDISTGYKVIAGNFVLQQDAAEEIKLWYYTAPPYFTTSEVNVPVDSRMEHAARALIFYACALGMAREDESERFDLYMGQYASAKVAIAQTNAKRRPGRSGQWVVIR